MGLVFFRGSSSIPFVHFMANKINIAILCGGKSAEHEISLLSARNVVQAIDPKKYEVSVIGIAKDGRWHRYDPSSFLLNPDDPKKIRLAADGTPIAITPGEPGIGGKPVDVVFPILHGTYGEDGTVQGFLKMAGVPFVGASVLGSAVGMDKDVLKRLLRDARIPVAKFLSFTANEKISVDHVVKELGLPCFVKPANLGSSVGISKVKQKAELEKAVQEAFRYDSKILIEEFIEGREIECAVLGNDAPSASVPGEIIPHHEFYSYEAKYLDNHGASLEIPAKLPAPIVRKIQELAARTFKVLCCEGMARVDFFLKKNDGLVVNELNTIPGFTRISMYPKMWEASGLAYPNLIDKLIQLALERFEREKKLRTSVT